MIGENRQLVTDEPVEFEKNNRLKSKTARKLPVILEEFIEYTPISYKKGEGYQHVTGWTCKHSDLNRWLWCPKISPVTGKTRWSGRTGSMLQMNSLSLRNNRLKFKTARKLPIILGGSYRIYHPNLIQESQRISTCNRLDLQRLGSQPVVVPKNLPDRRCGIKNLVIWFLV